MNESPAGVEFIVTDRGRFAVRVDGPDDAPALVLLHGWPQSSYCWSPVMDALSGSFRVVRPDLRGLGDSERTPGVEPYAKQSLADDILGLLDALGIDAFGLAGHDWGGAVAQEIAFAAPTRVARLAIMNIHLLANAVGYQAANRAHAKRMFRAYWYQQFLRTPGLAEAMVPGNERAFLGTFLRGRKREFAFPADAVDEYVRCYSQPGTAASGAGYYRAMSLDAPRWKALTGTVLPMPTLLAYGVHDPVIIPDFLQGHRDVFESVEVVEVDASHFLVEERPDVLGPLLAGHFST